MAVIDLKQFHATFFAESASGLDAMETDLLRLEANTGDVDTMHAIFRAVHSIKGAAGTFGFNEIAGFTHGLETFLDKMRTGGLHASAAIVNLLLKSVDTLRALLAAAQAGHSPSADAQRSHSEVLAELAAVDTAAAIANAGARANDGDAASASANVESSASATIATYRIDFAPAPHLLTTGNDPLRLLQVLARMGDTLEVYAHLDALPELEEMLPETCYLRWELLLTTAAARAEIDDVFAWVADDCRLAIETVPANAADATDPVPAAPAAMSAGTTAAPYAAPGNAHLIAQTRPRERGESVAASGSLHVSTEKVDDLINLVGELVITQTMLKQIGENLTPAHLSKLQETLAQLERNTRELQHRVMSIRMLPASFAFNRFARMVRDTSQALGKQVELKISGEQSELDKTVIEKLIDPLTHLIRNSLDHGIEAPATRVAAGKPAVATLSLHAEHKGGNIVIRIADDGQGLNREKIRTLAIARGLIGAEQQVTDEDIYRLIFLPGFSTADVVTDVSGRGVGMDVVRRNIESLGGNIDIHSEPGKGVAFTVRLPLTLAIVDGMSIALRDQTFILPLTFIVESIRPQPRDVRAVNGRGRVIEVRGEFVPVIVLQELLGFAGTAVAPEDGILVLVEAEGRKVALQVDALIGQDQVVIKSLEANYRKVRYMSGATILGDGRVALILDVAALVRSG